MTVNYESRLARLEERMGLSDTGRLLLVCVAAGESQEEAERRQGVCGPGMRLVVRLPCLVSELPDV